jgi:hypothetical protein
MANEQQTTIVRQNQSNNVRQLLKDKGIINLVSTFEVAIYCELWTDFCTQGLTPDIKRRFKAFDGIIQDRMKESEVDGIIID